MSSWDEESWDIYAWGDNTWDWFTAIKKQALRLVKMPMRYVKSLRFVRDKGSYGSF